MCKVDPTKFKNQIEADFKKFTIGEYKDVKSVEKWKQKQIRALIKTYSESQKAPRLVGACCIDWVNCMRKNLGGRIRQYLLY